MQNFTPALHTPVLTLALISGRINLSLIYGVWQCLLEWLHASASQAVRDFICAVSNLGSAASRLAVPVPVIGRREGNPKCSCRLKLLADFAKMRLLMPEVHLLKPVSVIGRLN